MRENFGAIDKNCEHDCQYLCTGCDKYLCEIKEEFGIPHEEELPETIHMDNGNIYCHRDCLSDCY